MIIRMICFRESKKFAYINDILYYYCIHDNNISKSIEKTENIKSLDHLFLTIELYQLSKKLKINDEITMFYCIMHELGVVLWLRTRKIDKRLRREAFQFACNFINKIKYCSELDYNITKDTSIISNIFKRNDYLSWRLYAIYMMLEIKYGVE